MKPARLLRFTLLLAATASLLLASQVRSQVVINSFSFGLSRGANQLVVASTQNSRSSNGMAIAGYQTLVDRQNLKVGGHGPLTGSLQAGSTITGLDISKQTFPAISLLFTAEVLPESPSYALIMAALTLFGVAYVRSRQSQNQSAVPSQRVRAEASYALSASLQ